MKKQYFLLAILVVLALFAIFARSGLSVKKVFEPDESFTVKLTDSTFGQDDNGNPIIVIHYNFSNDGNEDRSAAEAFEQQAFQAGTKLELASVLDTAIYDNNICETEVAAGTSIENCQIAFVLLNSAPVEFEITSKSDSVQKYITTFVVPETDSDSPNSIVSTTSSFSYSGGKIAYDGTGKTFKSIFGTAVIDSFTITDVRQTSFGDLDISYEIIGTVTGGDSLTLDLKCYDSGGFLVGSGSIYGSVSNGEKFKINNDVLVPSDTVRVQLAGE